MTGDPTTSTDFGNISETEADVLQRVISILRPDEGAQDGFAVSIEHGRRVWHHHRASLTFVLTGVWMIVCAVVSWRFLPRSM